MRDWFLWYWSSVGLGAAVVLGLLMFCTNACRSRPEVSRWRDPVWVAWTFTLVYLLHNFEEYGFDAQGRQFSFPQSICQMFGFDSLATCPISLWFVLAVNLPIIWITLPVAAVLSRRHPAVGLTGAGFVFTNAVTHIGSAFIAGYNPGLITAALLFLPLTIWTYSAFFGRGKLLRAAVFGIIVLASLLLNAVMMALIQGQMHESISVVPASIIQTLAAPILLLGLPWLAERKWPPTPQHAQAAAMAS